MNQLFALAGILISCIGIMMTLLPVKDHNSYIKSGEIALLIGLIFLLKGFLSANNLMITLLAWIMVVIYDLMILVETKSKKIKKGGYEHERKIHPTTKND